MEWEFNLTRKTLRLKRTMKKNIKKKSLTFSLKNRVLRRM